MLVFIRDDERLIIEVENHTVHMIPVIIFYKDNMTKEKGQMEISAVLEVNDNFVLYFFLHTTYSVMQLQFSSHFMISRYQQHGTLSQAMHV